MPFFLEETELAPEVAGFKSVLIVPCRFCPAASMAVGQDEPYLELHRRFLKTDSYERLIDSMKSSLESKGIRTGVFRSRWVHQLVLCMWTRRRREKLLARARDYEALVVIGCEAAVDTVRDAVKSADCTIIQGMKTKGIMSIQPRFHLPCSVSLELQGISPTVFPKPQPQLGVPGEPSGRRGSTQPIGPQPSSLRSQRNTFSASR